MPSIFQVLHELHIPYHEYQHPAVFTCEEAALLCPEMPGSPAKSLFLRDKKGEHYFLVILKADKKLDIKQLAVLVGTKGLSFASEERLREMLGVSKGSVTPFGLINDAEKKTRVFIDQDLWNEEWVHFHPLVNTATVALLRTDFERFLDFCGNPYGVITF